MAAKKGDIVRYLNAVGGGRVLRIEGQTAIVDDDGFETPVPVRECVVVRTAEQDAAARPKPAANAPVVSVKAASAAKSSATSAPAQAPAPVVAPKAADSGIGGYEADSEPDEEEETPNGNVLNVVLGFEAINPREMSHTDYEASLVNDSNYYLYFTFLTAEADTPELWTTRYAGVVEPNIQLLLGTFTPEDVSRFDRIAVQYVAFKRRSSFEPKAPASVSYKVDTTKFFKLHCFRENMYFDAPVLAFQIVRDDKPCNTPEPQIDTAELEREMRRKKAADSRRPVRRRVEHHADNPNEPLVVDLHISELVDNTRGLSNADMLNLQIDRFRDVMRKNLRNVGRRIIFIHGKGEGVLRQALMKELSHMFKGHDVQDASFREYGYGATQVTIRNVRR